MRNSVEELNQIPSDFSVDSAKEITPPPDEFNAAAVRKRPEKKVSSIRKVMLYLASIGVVTLGIITPDIRIQPPESADRTAAVSATPSTAAGATAAPAPETPAAGSTEAAILLPTPEPTEMPPLSGKIHIVVYSEILAYDSSEPFPSEVLADVTLDAATFTGYTLPPLPTQEGYKALGYVLLRSSGLAYLETLYYNRAEPGTIGTKALGSELTANDLGIVPKNADGVYEAEIHVVWVQNNSRFHLEFYDETLIGEYDVGFPVSSDGLCYLAAFPEPVRKGKTFIGWSDVNGHMIDAVTYFDFFAPKQGAKTIEDREWNRPIACKVYACWSDGTGGAPYMTAMPREASMTVSTAVPTAEPMCRITCAGCSIQANNVFGREGTVPAGTVVTVFAWQSYHLGYFTMTTASGKTVRTDSIEGSTQYGSSYAYETYMFTATFTVTEDVTITFSSDFTSV